MDLSLIYELQTGDTSLAGVRRCYEECLDQVMLADELGYRTVWLVEHHFLGPYSYSSAPELFFGYLASRTKRIRLGHGIVQLPFKINHPLRVAERIALLDVLSGGRVEFGGGRAVVISELEAFGVNPDETRAQWEESLRMLPKMWMEETFSWSSELISIPPRTVVPKPVQQPHPPMWVACTQPATIEYAARHGLGALGFGISGDLSKESVRIYRDGLKFAEPIGAFVNGRFALMVTTLCCSTDEEAIALQGPNMKRMAEHTRRFYTPWIEGEAPKTYQHFVKGVEEGFQQLQTASLQDVVKGSCVGSPETCLEVLQKLSDDGVDEVLLLMQMYTTPHEAIMQSIKNIAQEVRPRLKPSARPNYPP
jgi:alkanesulfonate monooxygenase SsuD/methylene tetrahydromethanopterin reductase-like flavin-dependent oxidoreductase (luciferase family)